MFTVDTGILFVTDQCVAVFELKGDSSSSSALLFYRGDGLHMFWTRDG